MRPVGAGRTSHSDLDLIDTLKRDAFRLHPLALTSAWAAEPGRSPIGPRLTRRFHRVGRTVDPRNELGMRKRLGCQTFDTPGLKLYLIPAIKSKLFLIVPGKGYAYCQI